MNNTLRKLTTIFFFILFFVLSPLIIFYAKGYRFNTDTRSVEKNGAFYVKSFPKGADIYVDDVRTDKKTPTQLIDIKPDLHKLKVAKELYTDWEKELKIYPGETTFAEDVVLFLSSRPKEVLDNGSTNYVVNESKDKYAYINEANSLFITDLEQARTVQVYDFSQNLNLLDWSYDNESILLSDENFYYIFNINKKELEKINLKVKDKIVWDNKNTNIIWFLSDAKLYTYDFSSKNNLPEAVAVKSKIFIINDFDILDDNIILQYEFNENQFVEQLQKSDFATISSIKDLSYGKIETLVANDDNLILILGSKLLIKNKERDLISIPVTKAKIHDDRILITSGHEILLYNFKEDWQELIDRSSQIVSDILWHPNGSYFLSEIDGQTKITEIDGRDRRNSIDIYKDYLKKLYLFNKKGDKLFVLSPEENFYLTIQ